MSNIFNIIAINMYKLLLLTLLLLGTKIGFAQTHRDSLVYNLPLVNGKLTYADSVKVKGRSKVELDTAAKKWFYSYFKYYNPDTLSKDIDHNSVILNQAAVIFKMTTSSLALVKYDFYLIFSIKINCTDNKYTYKIFDIYFVPKSDLFRNVGYYQHSPDYLIGIYRQKHLSMVNSINIGRKKIREYLKNTDDGISACIASLNLAMKGDKL